MERNDLVLYLDIPEFSEALHASKWRTDIVLPQAGDNICPENLLSEKTLAMLETVSAGEVWEDMKDDCRTMRRVVEHELFRVTERGFHLRRDGTPCCTLTLQRYRVHDAGRRMKTEVPPPCPARGVERKSGKIRFYFRKYFVHIDVPDTLPQYPEVREFVNIKSLLSEADRKLLAETECDEAESLLEWIENEGYCHVRARCWTPEEESGGWMCVLSVDVCKYSINSLVYWVTYVHNVVYSFYRSMIYCYINSTQRCAGSIVIDIIPTNGADKRKFFPFAPYFPVTNVIKRYFYPYFPAIIGIKGYSFPYFPYLSGIMKIKTALYSLFSRLDWHKTVVFPCLGEIYEGIRSLSWEIPVT